jgi:pyridoxamine 5'-phosphate oxidase
MSIADIRKDYQLKSLSELEVNNNPFSQFSSWWDEAVQSEIDEVNAMTLSTITTEGRPSSRIVLLKGFDERGFVFLAITTVTRVSKLAATVMYLFCFFGKS